MAPTVAKHNQRRRKHYDAVLGVPPGYSQLVSGAGCVDRWGRQVHTRCTCDDCARHTAQRLPTARRCFVPVAAT
jgi:hypothetical protein